MIIVVSKILVGLMPAIILAIWKNFINSITDIVNGKNLDVKKSIYMILLYCCLILVKDILIRVIDYYFRWESDRLMQSITDECIDKISVMRLCEVENSENLDLINKVNEQTGSNIQSILECMFAFIESTITFVSILSLMIDFSIIPLVLCVVSSLLSFEISLKIIDENYRIMNHRHEKCRYISCLKNLIYNSNNIKEMKVYRCIDFLKSIIDRNYDSFLIEDCKMRRKSLFYISLAEIIDFGFLYMSKIHIILKAVAEKSQIGTLTMNISCVEQFAGSLTRIMDVIKELYSCNLYLDNLRDMRKIDCDVNVELKRRFGSFETIKSIELRNVSFKHGNDDRDIISDINYEFEAGKSYCIVGSNGSGKTTLLNIISNIYEPTAGKVLINGENIGKLVDESVYSHFCVMFQNYIKYPFTVEDNILLGRDKNKSEANLMEISRRSGSQDFISKMPKGYKSQLQKEWTDGVDISGGEWQRLAIDRAIYSNGDVYIFDEPTSAIDELSEKCFFDWINTIQNKIIIYVVHKTDLAKRADVILVMEDGHLVEVGCYSELIEQRQAFYRMAGVNEIHTEV